MYYLYILKSLNNNKFYIGVSKDIKERLHKHNKGWSKSTKPFKPWEIAYTEEFIDKKLAYKREFFLKSPMGYLEKKAIFSRLI